MDVSLYLFRVPVFNLHLSWSYDISIKHNCNRPQQMTLSYPCTPCLLFPDIIQVVIGLFHHNNKSQNTLYFRVYILENSCYRKTG